MIRIKMGQLPGDFGRRDKIRLMEGTETKFLVNLYGGREKYRQHAKTFRRLVLSKTRTVLKRRTAREIEDQCP